jgi:hypothetical protein
LRLVSDSDHATRPGHQGIALRGRGRLELTGTGPASAGIAGKRWNMQAPVQEVETAQVIVLMIAITVAACWRTVVRWLIVLAVTAIIATMGFGLIMIWQITHHMTG